MIITCLAILAVDFRIFPRRFAKVETWGTSLMDMGVGSFVFSAGLVSARPILKSTPLSSSASQQPQNPPIFRLLRSGLRSALPLFVLGVVRLWSVKKVDYAEHVSEYGIHWNFFFTLSLLPFFASIVSPLPSPIRCHILPFALTSIYQLLLSHTRLQAYILTAPRITLLSQNREGVFSFVGYFALFLHGQGLGLQILPRIPSSVSSESTPKQARYHLLGFLALYGAASYALYHVSTSVTYGLRIHPSRRLANAPYVEWVVWFNTFQLLLYCLVETVCFPALYQGASTKADERKEVKRATSRVLRAFNRNGLAVFLVANLVTGAVNLSFDTIGMGKWGSIGVLGVYAILVTIVAVVLDIWDVSVKL